MNKTIISKVFIFISLCLLLQKPADTIKSLIHDVPHALRHFKSFSKNLTTPGSGEKSAMPSVANSALYLIRKYDLKFYGLSPGISNNPLHYQRIAEGAYPCKISVHPNKLLILDSEIIKYSDFNLIEKTNEVMLVSRY
jgi:hypothetical protein